MAAGKRKPVPEWAKAPFRGFNEYIESEERLVRLASQGIGMVARNERLAEALFEYDTFGRTLRGSE